MDSEVEKALADLEKTILSSMDLQKDLPGALKSFRDILESKKVADTVEDGAVAEESEEKIQKLNERLAKDREEFADAIQVILDRTPDAQLRAALKSFTERITIETKFLDEGKRKGLKTLATLSLFDH